MRLWLVHRENWDYDEYDAFVFRAESEDAALAMAVEREPDPRGDGDHVWIVAEVPMDGEPGEILASFNAG